MKKTLGSFSLNVSEDKFIGKEIIVMLGQNGTGKSTLSKMLAGILKPDDENVQMPELFVSYKP